MGIMLWCRNISVLAGAANEGVLANFFNSLLSKKTGSPGSPGTGAVGAGVQGSAKKTGITNHFTAEHPFVYSVFKKLLLFFKLFLLTVYSCHFWMLTQLRLFHPKGSSSLPGMLLESLLNWFFNEPVSLQTRLGDLI